MATKPNTRNKSPRNGSAAKKNGKFKGRKTMTEKLKLAEAQALKSAELLGEAQQSRERLQQALRVAEEGLAATAAEEDAFAQRLLDILDKPIKAMEKSLAEETAQRSGKVPTS